MTDFWTDAAAQGKGRRSGRMALAFAAAVAAVFIGAANGRALAQVVEDSPVRRIVVTLNKSKTLTFKAPFASAVIGSPDVADLLPMTDHTLYVQGKKVGTTNISVFDAEKRLVAVVDLEVALDTASLAGKIVASTGSAKIRANSANGEVVLSGEASDAVSAARAVDVAKSMSRDSKGNDVPVVNAMRVAPNQQVMLKVRFLEVDRTAGRDLGVNFYGQGRTGLGVSGLGSVSQSAAVGSQTVTTTAPNGAQTTTGTSVQSLGVVSGTAGNQLVPMVTGVLAGAAGVTPFGALLAQVVNSHGVKIDSLVSALETKGLVKTLAEPNLIAQSGERASFFAGSQVPIPSVQTTTGSTPLVTVNYFPCGVTLDFVPTVLNTGLVNVHLGPKVCQISGTNSVNVNGTTIPELNTRSAETTVELRDGQSFAIAGLLQAQDVNQLSQLPWLGNVPVLGALFRSTSYQKSETDLVVIVTVRLVKPVPPGKHLATPFDDTISANDMDLFLMGDVERKKKYTEFVTSGGGLQGPYGHILEAR